MKTLYRLTFLFLAIVSLYACNASHKTEAETVKRLLSSNDSLQQIYLSQIPYDSVAIFSKTFLSTLDTIRRYSIFPEDKMQRYTVRYVFVNIAAQEVEAVADNRVEFRQRVVVGKRDRQTPELSSAVSSVILNPYWFVPKSIAI